MLPNRSPRLDFFFLPLIQGRDAVGVCRDVYKVVYRVIGVCINFSPRYMPHVN